MRLVAALTLVLSASALACKSGPAWDRLAEPPALAARSVEVVVHDARTGVMDSVDVPTASMPWQAQEGAVPLEDVAHFAIEDPLKRVLAAGERSLRLDVRVTEGIAGWEGELMSEREHARATVEVAVVDAASGALLAHGSASSSASRRAFDISDRSFASMLTKVIAAATFEFLASEPASALRAPR